MNGPKKVDGVFEGGGVKGIALIGAAEQVEAAGYRFQSLAGTSAGAIVATLLAAGYSAAELKPILMGIDFRKFMDTSGILGHIPLAGRYFEILAHLGIYEGDYFLNLMRELLAARIKKPHGQPITFRDLADPTQAESRYRYKVHVIASDISRGRMLVLPEDIRAYGRDPDDLEVALAVRMSMSIPYFFKPVTLEGPGGSSFYVVDGGLLSNFPIELFDTRAPEVPEWPTFGFTLVSPGSQAGGIRVEHDVNGPITMLWALFNTAMEAHDAHYMSQPDVNARTIAIDDLGISATNFELNQEQKDRLFAAGQDAARSFLAGWDFDRYIAEFRAGERPQVAKRPAGAPPAPSAS